MCCRVWYGIRRCGLCAAERPAAVAKRAVSCYGTFTPGIRTFAGCKLAATLVERLARFQRYPAQARGVEGVVSVAFSIDRQGKLVSSRIVKSSGSALLDAEALDLIKRAVPLPPPPAEIADSQLSFVVPIRFTER